MFIITYASFKKRPNYSRLWHQEFCIKAVIQFNCEDCELFLVYTFAIFDIISFAFHLLSCISYGSLASVFTHRQVHHIRGQWTHLMLAEATILSLFEVFITRKVNDSQPQARMYMSAKDRDQCLSGLVI